MNIQRIHVVWVALLSVIMALSGCIGGADTDSDPAQSQQEQRAPETLGTKGAIRGLVVDDNFRPVQLKEEWDSAPGDFQDVGFVLILETGQRFETNENGEFTVLPLEPGAYTIRVAADVHEAKDQTVNVVSGEFAEVTVEARRQYSGGGTVLSQEYVVFAGCNVRAFVIGFSNVMCGDMSGDSQRAAFSTDYSSIEDIIRGMVTEMRAHQDGWYRVHVRNTAYGDCGDFSNGCLYYLGETPDTRYLRGVTYPGKNWLPNGEYLEEGQDGYCDPEGYASGKHTDCQGAGYMAPSFAIPFDTILFPEHPIRNHYQGTPIQNFFGVGLVLGIKAQFLQNVFLYELPEEGIQDFCALCDDADIPE